MPSILIIGYGDDTKEISNEDIVLQEEQSGKFLVIRGGKGESISPSEVSDLIMKVQKNQEFKRGDTVLVWDDEDDEKVKRIYLCTVAGAHGPHICVTKSHEQNFMSNRPFKTCGWDNCDRVL